MNQVALDKIEFQLNQEIERIANIRATLAKILEADDEYIELGETMERLLTVSAAIRDSNWGLLYND